MKRTALFFMIFLAGLVFSASLFAAGKTELKVTNKTGALVQEIKLTETDTGKIRSYYPQLENKTSTTVKIKKGTYYDITLVDSNQHAYGIKRHKWERDFNEVEISHSDFIYQGVGDVIKRLFWR